MINDLFLSELDEEVKKTRALLERVPMNADFKPHAKSMPLGKLAVHVAELPGFGHTILTTPDHDFSAGPQRTRPAFESPQQLVKAFEQGVAKVRTALDNTSDSAWNDLLEAQLSGQDHLRRIAFSGLPADVPESPRPSSSATWRVFADE